MGKVTLCLGIHNHQPQGNFEHVFVQGYEDCYARLLGAVERHPGVRFTLHYSGPLIEWLDRHHPDYFDTLATLVESGQVELMGGGFYEPMLSVLPERDAQGQLELMAEFLEGRVGHRPRGMWLAERVWEPDLARTIATAGYRYTIVDDGHFLAAGMRRPLRGYYLTEKAGLPLCLFPISIELRYAIPFKPAEEAIEALRQVAEAAGDGNLVVTYGDDGEKFGMWPGTKKWVWEEGWLESFLGLVEANADWLQTRTFSEVMQGHEPSGRVYLPTASYDEMGEWSLPAEAQGRFHELAHAIEGMGHREDWGPFVRGGIWPGFMAKYPEADFMHKRMCHVSDRVARAAAAVDEDSDLAQQKHLEMAQRELYRGQCNCAYWHGLFGGLYLRKLRAAVHSHLLRADVEVSQVLGLKGPVELERIDLDADLSDEVLLTGRYLGVIVAPARGGALLALDDRRRAICLTDVLTRRPEAYHAKVLEPARASDSAAEGAPQSIHDIVHLKEEGLADLLIYDPHQRLAFVDQFFPTAMDLEDLWRCRPRELGTFKGATYDLLQAAGGTGRLLLGCNGRVQPEGGEAVEVTLRKTFQLSERTLAVEYEIVPHSPLREIRFATELSLVLPAGIQEIGEIQIAGKDATHEAALIGSRGVSHEVTRIELTSAAEQLSLTLHPTPPATVVHFPIETASQSESGIERTYQGTVITLLWTLSLEGEQGLRPGITLHLR